MGARRQGVAEIPGGSGIRCRDGNELEGGNQAALLDSGLGGCVAAEGGGVGGRHSVNAKLGRASRLTRGDIEVAAGPAGAAVATHDNAGDRGRWGIERLVEGRSACDAVLENEAGGHVRKVSVWGVLKENTKGIVLFRGFEGVGGGSPVARRGRRRRCRRRRNGAEWRVGPGN